MEERFDVEFTVEEIGEVEGGRRFQEGDKSRDYRRRPVEGSTTRDMEHRLNGHECGWDAG